MKLIVFDVDGTLVDSQADILGAMEISFGSEGLKQPTRSDVLSIVGLSLPQAMAVLAPEADERANARLVEGYKAAYVDLRAKTGVAESSPLYPGIREMLDQLNARDDVLLGVATGKSRRGLDMLIEGHGLKGYFVTEQVSDHHPSKPHPAMLLTAMSEAGVERADTVMIGDTRFDMDMAASAGCIGIGVTWGYHPARELAAAQGVIDRIDELPRMLNHLWGMTL